MRNYWIPALLITLGPSIGAAQTSSAPLKLTIDDAVRMALQNNLELATARIDPQISDARVAGASSIFQADAGHGRVCATTSCSRRGSFLIPTSTRNDVVTSNVGLNKQLPMIRQLLQRIMGYHTHQQQQFPEQLQSAASGRGCHSSFSQPLLRDFRTDGARANLS